MLLHHLVSGPPLTNETRKYECCHFRLVLSTSAGIEPVSSSWNQRNFTHYMILLLMLVFIQVPVQVRPGCKTNISRKISTTDVIYLKPTPFLITGLCSAVDFERLLMKSEARIIPYVCRPIMNIPLWYLVVETFSMRNKNKILF